MKVRTCDYDGEERKGIHTGLWLGNLLKNVREVVGMITLRWTFGT
jgi:hypothetical protein